MRPAMCLKCRSIFTSSIALDAHGLCLPCSTAPVPRKPKKKKRRPSAKKKG